MSICYFVDAKDDGANFPVVANFTLVIRIARVYHYSMGNHRDAKMTTAELDQLRTKVEADFQKRLEAIAIVQAMLHEAGHATVAIKTASQNGTAQKPHRTARRGAVLKVISEIVEGLHGEFTIRDVDEKLEAANKKIARGSLKAALARLSEEGQTELVKMGAGRRPSVYRRK